ncbi:hypothetical protein LCL89_06545 [Halobacillus yeomjeoni]|nr:hypothetical protein [Halobacillus yeomjeoni]MCA0983715.1 hypothetical protein [Halobacillus yeomjeoni]
MNVLEMYPWITPLLWLIVVISIFWSYHSFRSKRYSMLVLSGMLQTILSPLFAFTIGPILLALGLTQFYMGIVNAKRVKAVRHD